MNPSDYMTEVVAGVHFIEPPKQYRSLENPALSLNDPRAWEEVFGGSSRAETGELITSEKALMYAPLWHAVQLISGDIAKLPLRLYKRRTDISEEARERDREHPLGRVLGVAANSETESVKFWGRFMVHVLLWGNAYAYILRDGMGRPAELLNLLPDRTTIEYVNGQKLYVTEVGGKLKALLSEDVLHVEGLTVGGAGMVVFSMARNSIGLGLAQEKFASKFFKNGGRIGGTLELPLGMGKPARDQVEEGFRKVYEGQDSAFKTVILRENAKFHAGQMSPRDSQMVEANEAQTRAIAHWFNLAPSKLGLSDSVSYNSKAEDNQNYLDTTLSIWLTRIAASCNFRLLDEREQGTHFIEHSTAALLRMNPLDQAERFSKLIGALVMNPNEARAELNMLPYDGGDEFVNPSTMSSGAPEEGEEGGTESKGMSVMDLTYAIQKIYLGVGKVISASEAREILNREGAGLASTLPEGLLNVPAPAQPFGGGPPSDEPPDDKPQRSPEFKRAIFDLTWHARNKAIDPRVFASWVDGNLHKQRSDYSGQEPVPFIELACELKRNLETWKRDELVAKVDEWCQNLERKLT